MTIPIEAYSSAGVVTGLVDATGGMRDLLETLDAIRIAPCHVMALDGAVAERAGSLVPIDDLLLVVPEPAAVAVHAAWHDIGLTVGPWRVDGLLATQPGFDPGRALTRPGGTYVPLRDATVRVAADPGRLIAVHPELLVHRYAVEVVECALSLPFHFPGAVLRGVEPAPEADGARGPAGPAPGRVVGAGSPLPAAGR